MVFLFFFISLAKTSFSTNDTNKTKDNNPLIIKEISIRGNNKTKEEYILRELEININDSISINSLNSIIDRLKSNLLKTGLFNFVNIKTKTQNNNLTLSIKVEERWYIWPYPILEYAHRNFPAWLKEKDISRTNYGLFVTKYNCRGRNETFKIKARFGYREQFGFNYDIPNLNKKKTIGIKLATDYFRQKQFTSNIVHNSPTYTTSEKYIYKQNRNTLVLSYRPQYNFFHYITLTHNKFIFDNKLISSNKNFLPIPNSSPDFLYFNYTFLFENLDLLSYPTNGFMTKINLNYTRTLTQNYNSKNIDFEIGLYKEISDRFYFSQNTKISTKKENITNIFSEIITDNNNYIRGFEYYLIKGNNYYVGKTSIRYEIIPYSIMELPIINLSQFKKVHYAVYIGAFYDFGYYQNNTLYKENSLMNQYLYSTGIGIDFVTYYDKILRIEFAYNKMNEAGIFIHFGAPIIGNNIR